MGRNSRRTADSSSPSKSRSTSPTRRRSATPPQSGSYSKRRSLSRSRSRSPPRRNGNYSSGPNAGGEQFRLHIGELGNDPDKAEIERAFSRFGHPTEVWVARAPPCFAFVVYSERRQAERAIEAMDGKALGDSDRIRVTWAKPRVGGGSGGGGGGGGGGRGGGGGERRDPYNPNLRCYQCGDLGHFSRECTATGSAASRRNDYNSRGRDRDRERPSGDWNRGGKDRDRRFPRDEQRDRRYRSPPTQSYYNSSGYDKDSSRREDNRYSRRRYDNENDRMPSKTDVGGGGDHFRRRRPNNYDDRKKYSPIIDLSPNSDRS